MSLSTIKTSLRGTILVIDDDAAVLETLQMLLEHAGHTARGVATSEQAVELLRRDAFDLVITDLHLTGDSRSGLDLIDYVTHFDETIPIILITAYPSIRSAVDAIKRGAVDFLPKPIEREQLLHLVSRGLQERQLRRENHRLQAEVNKAAVIDQLNRQLNDRVTELTRLYTIAEGLNPFLDTAALFDKIVELAGVVTGARRVSVMVFDRTRRFLRIRAARGLAPELIRETRVLPGEGISGRVAESGRAVRMTQSIIQTQREAGTRGERPYSSTSWLAVPLFIGKELFGVVNLTDKPDCGDFTREDEQIVSSLVEKAAMKLENQALYEGIYSNLIDTLNSLVTTIEAKDPYTGEHSQRVTDYAIQIARHMGLSEDHVEMLSFAGMLHDIGKIGVRDEILVKRGPLTPEEVELIKMHPVIGERIVEPLGLVREETALIRHHHERYDGKGYPDGLAGEQIPILARIIAVADAFDAMTTTRSYRRARSAEEALREMQRCVYSQFDPKVVPSLTYLVESGRICVPAPVIEMANEIRA